MVDWCGKIIAAPNRPVAADLHPLEEQLVESPKNLWRIFRKENAFQLVDVWVGIL